MDGKPVASAPGSRPGAPERPPADDSLQLRMRRARADIRSGALRGDALLQFLLSVPTSERDGWVDALLGFDEPPPDIADLPRGAVPYLPCGVDEILAMVAEVPLRRDDTFVDLGSGLGRVAILAHLLSGARAQGVEIQEPLVHRARACCAELALPLVSFVHANAADIELDGSVFFLYSPFNGEMLSAVLRRLEDVARRRPIVVCAVDFELHGVPWLRERKTPKVSLTLYDSCVPGVPLR
ncbi:class I SAM-dependent methyltransferase [Corallococcus exercitus]|uniref:class I SAM-dependent methyltransferase n=1 Tax=Corallococcus exercitus TaxID=2316736 RepID=UPI000EA187C2|nr:class I SAM-dependent methyltransferase [Corallococcus exercitus]RKG80802.1 class I SAM-dependent methyltransferase [Corallococcus exercitus]